MKRNDRLHSRFGRKLEILAESRLLHTYITDRRLDISLLIHYGRCKV